MRAEDHSQDRPFMGCAGGRTILTLIAIIITCLAVYAIPGLLADYPHRSGIQPPNVVYTFIVLQAALASWTLVTIKRIGQVNPYAFALILGVASIAILGIACLLTTVYFAL